MTAHTDIVFTIFRLISNRTKYREEIGGNGWERGRDGERNREGGGGGEEGVRREKK